MSGYTVSHNGQNPYGHEYDILNAELKRLYIEEQLKEKKVKMVILQMKQEY